MKGNRKGKLFFVCLLTLALLSFALPVQAEPASGSDFAYEIGSDGQIVLTEYLGSRREVTVPAVIDGYAVRSTYETFADRGEIEKVTFENGLTSIGYGTFSGCTALKEVQIPESVTALGDYAFSETALPSLTLPETTSYIGTGCFYGCAELRFVKAEAESLFLSELAFAQTGLEIMQVSNKPQYYDNSFSQPCRFSYNAVETFSMRHEPLYTVLHWTGRQPVPIRALLLLALMLPFIGIICLLSGVMKKIRVLFGKDNPTQYKNYDARCKNSIRLREEQTVFLYKEPPFRGDNIRRTLFAVAVTLLYIAGWSAMTFLLLDLFGGKLTVSPVWLGFLVRGLVILAGLAFYLFLTFQATRLFLAINAKLHENSLFKSKVPKTRIRRIGKGKKQ